MLLRRSLRATEDLLKTIVIVTPCKKQMGPEIVHSWQVFGMHGDYFTKRLPGVTKECFLEALKCGNTSKQRLFETPGRSF